LIFGPEFPKSRDALREGFYQLLARGYELEAKRGAGLAAYRGGIALLATLCAQDWAQRTMFPREAMLVRRFVAESKLAADAEATVRESLMLHSCAAVWRRALQQLGREPFAELARVRGEEHLRATLAQGRGAMLVHSHTLFASMFWTWLEHAGIAPGVAIGHWAWAQARGHQRSEASSWVPEVARELHQANATMRAGGLAHLFGDGVQGGRQTEVAFCSRRRGFRPAFAEIALGAGAPVLTTAVRLAPDGTLHFEIDAPLEDDAAAPRAERIARLLAQYVERLARRWREAPAQIPWNDMVNHLRFAAL
jgi:lauroyl/myristoyl acyltransferase